MLTAAQCRMARSALRWTVQQLADRARVNRNTITSFELERTEPNPATLTVIRQAFDAAGVEFTNGDQPGVRLRAHARDAP